MIDNTVKIIKHKVGLLNLAEELGNVSRACKVMGLSRDTFYRYKSAVESGGVEALFDQSRRKPNHKNRVEEPIELAVKDYAIEYPAHGQQRTSNELRKKGIFVSPSGVRSVWLRYNLANFKDRLKALEDKVASEGIILTESQIAALEKKKFYDEACCEIETVHPGYLGSQDTFYVGTLKGVGRIYQTFIDTYSKVAFAKLYTTKKPITSADILNDKILPFFDYHRLPVLRILTDRGTEYCGKVEQHDYQLSSPLTILTTRKLKCCHHKLMVFVSAFIKRFCKNFTKSPHTHTHVFIFASFGTFFIMNGPFNRLLLTFFNSEHVIILLLVLIVVTLIFNKQTERILKQMNRYTWLIIICYLSATLAMEYQNYKLSVPFEGVFMTLPLVLAFIYWSQKNNSLLSLKGSGVIKKEEFKIDLFLITTSFLLAGFVFLIMNLNNSDLKAFWPFFIIFISILGFIFSLIYALLGLLLDENHKQYTLTLSIIIMSIYSLLSIFPSKVEVLNIMEIETFYAISILLLSLHLGFILVFQLKLKRLKS